jgi:methionyl-tRNA formyltransferase|tara:strand:+ start:186 stop:770 length:585 start_codon:yes stop_codon:yes gene_type:complete
MSILFLGSEKEPQLVLLDFLSNEGNTITKHEEKLNIENIVKCNYDFLISFGYRYMVRKEILDYFKGKAINLHISYLPWNKGADPNLWSILEDTPKGVTIHQMDNGLDTGNILCQKEIFFDENDTLNSSYEKLQNELVKLFKLNWKNIKHNKVKPIKQKGKGTYHKSCDKNYYQELLTHGWETKVKDLIGKAVND